MTEYVTVGTCSICGGEVRIPKYWMSIIPPIPTCANCGATKRHGPVIDMVPTTETVDQVYRPVTNAAGKIK